MCLSIRCPICPKGCDLLEGELGDCGVRRNTGGKILCEAYGYPCSLNIDPIEKKPLYHFLPGSSIFSIATAGCNLHCKQCQNWRISQVELFDNKGVNKIFPSEIVELAKKHDCPSIAYTYTEPLVSYEYIYDCCKTAAESGIKNVLVTAAYINPAPLRNICRFVDAANVDLKSFSDDFYREVCNATLEPVLNALKTMKESGVMLEITNLLIPTLNDSEEETKRLCNWVVQNLGAETPVHFSRFFPQNKLKHLPPTPPETVLKAREIGLGTGLRFVYVGNMAATKEENTYCTSCGTLLIERSGYSVSKKAMQDGLCSSCGTQIYGIWE